MTNNSELPVLRDGYDLPVYGLDNGLFYALHVPAVGFIFISLCCVITAITLSFRRQSHRSFFSWTKCDRFVVYLAICDGLFNIVHICDHLQMIFTRDHVYPSELCTFNAFFQIVFISAQNLMVNIVAINIFTVMYFNKQIDFGRCDYKLILWTFGAPFAGAIACAAKGLFGPAGAFCWFDGVKGFIGGLFFITIPVLIIFSMNTVLYTVTWVKIRREMKCISAGLGEKPPTSSRKAAVIAARRMSLFVAAFFVQWCCTSTYSAWGIFGTPPVVLFHMVTVFANTGGILNLAVYIIVHRKELRRKAMATLNSVKENRTNNGTTESSNPIAVSSISKRTFVERL